MQTQTQTTTNSQTNTGGGTQTKTDPESKNANPDETGSQGTQGGEVDPNTTKNAQTEEADGQGDVDESGWDEKTKEYIAKLRKESAKYRTEAKDLRKNYDAVNERIGTLEGGLKKALGIESDDMSPEDQAKHLQAHAEDLTLQNAMLQTAYEYEIPRDGLEYFEFKMNKALAELGDDDELTEEDIQAIAKDVRSKVAGGTFSTTSVNTGKTPNDEGKTNNNDEVGLDEFVAMSTSEKSLLYQKNPDLYNKLIQTARRENRLIQ